MEYILIQRPTTIIDAKVWRMLLTNTSQPHFEMATRESRGLDVYFLTYFCSAMTVLIYAQGRWICRDCFWILQDKTTLFIDQMIYLFNDYSI